MKKSIQQLLEKLSDSSADLNHRSMMLYDLMAEAKDGGENASQAAEAIFERLRVSAGDKDCAEKAEILEKLIKQYELAPLRVATFLQMAQLDEGGPSHALVQMDNGDLAYVVPNQSVRVKDLELGQRVMLGADAKMLLHPASDNLHTGFAARFEHKLDERHIEVVTHQDERTVVLALPELIKQIDARRVTPGMSVIIGHKGRIALQAILREERDEHFRFLDRGAVPDVQVDRDIGQPPKVIGEVSRHIREEMTRPELRRRFRLRPCRTWLLRGVSGTGKTLAVQAIHRQMYEIMSEVTGTPIEQLPPRVFRFRNSKMLSMWLGESDKNADRIFDEVEKLAQIPYENHKGKPFSLPVLVVMEEADGFGRARGEEAIYDRILSTILQRLDPNRRGLSDRLVVFLSTTNEPHVIDPAFLRRIGGSIETFGRLNRDGFSSVFEKHVTGLPVDLGDGATLQAKAWRKITEELSDWLFVPGNDPGVVELTVSGKSTPVVRHCRHFLTGALIDRSVQQASTEAWEKSLDRESGGITPEHLRRSFSDQVRAVANQLTPKNIRYYLDIPESVSVTHIKVLQPKAG